MRVGYALEDDLAREVGFGAFVKCQDDVREAVERDRTHHAQIRRAVHREFEGERRESFNFFRRVTRPLRDQLDHRRRQVGIRIDRHALKRDGARDDDEQREHQYDEALLECDLDDAMDHCALPRCLSAAVNF